MLVLNGDKGNALLYAGIGTTVTYFVGRPMIMANILQNKAEADYRFALMRLRENSEGIALIRGEADESKGLTRFFGQVFGCGPNAMLAALAGRWPRAEVVVETYMGCGTGVCLGCAVPRTSGVYDRACREGPVYPAASVRWDELPSHLHYTRSDAACGSLFERPSPDWGRV